jgi:hypothetical protein
MDAPDLVFFAPGLFMRSHCESRKIVVASAVIRKFFGIAAYTRHVIGTRRRRRRRPGKSTLTQIVYTRTHPIHE